ncbi:acetyl/propionyl/methylcrotonyl-CoA carboxylase subunit alpha [Mongoliimonas terrestris]|uniref:acetyl/propionyl/methylcrotonyl-CoA carboxylase subunit alpha n=1 Tax=Mongoliimonas terrestris TaxID=1709001 RepID=UPI000949923C|nr:biotin carboxylase N-terminal domain-containing protein [Mongoliimonas terrestris]
MRPIRTLLVANRGEIAVRVMATARRMGIRTVAVFSDADADALHVRSADVAVRLGPAPARESYLAADRILDAARRTGADAVHPGYGFLSENAAFAEAVEAAGLVFVGPPAAAIRAMGSKSAAKALMAKAGVPLVPGYHGDDQDPRRLAEAAGAIGYPVLIKASAGGGGKGMKLVTAPAAFPDALASARREAAAAFGDDRVLVERYLTCPRHIEVQVFADAHGNTVHLFERDCSVQRRHQKVIEEAPAPGVSPARRAEMGAAAVAAARAVGYRGAGTVEFIAEGDGFYFMEMNTRLQVEHPVTEAITGLDLVEWQIRVARGEPLPLAQSALAIRGHAVEARLYAEDPAKGFLPQTGRLDALAFPPGVRVDTGVEPGDTVSHHYDPMIAKLIAHGPTRADALSALAGALDATRVVGLATNRALLARILRHPVFEAATHDTGFIEREADTLLAPDAPASADEAALAALALLAAESTARPTDAADPWSPFATAGAFTPNLPAVETVTLEAGGTRRHVRVETAGGRRVVSVDGDPPRAAAATLKGPRLGARLGDLRLTADVEIRDGAVHLAAGSRHLSFQVIDPYAGPHAGAEADHRLVAPMPGAVIAVAVAAGDRVEKGTALVVVEAMKMEHVVRAPHAGIVARVTVAVGDAVAEGTELVVLDDAP